MLLEIEKIEKSFRSLWISRINAGSRELVSYSENDFIKRILLR